MHDLFFLLPPAARYGRGERQDDLRAQIERATHSGLKIDYVDYKDVGLLKKLCTNQSKMFSRKRSGNCAAFQRAASDAVKRARYMALLPYVGE